MFEFVTGVAQDALYLTLAISAPVLAVSLLVGLLIGIFQSATQIQEQTLSFVPKLIAVLVLLAAVGPWMGGQLGTFAEQLWNQAARIQR